MNALDGRGLRYWAAICVLGLSLLAGACSSSDATPTQGGDPASPTVEAGVSPTAVAGGSGTPSAATATPTGVGSSDASNPTATVPGVSLQEIPIPPERDLYELGRRLRLRQAEPVPRIVEPAPPPLRVGDEVAWNVNRDSGNVSVTGRVMAVSENAYWIFDTTLLPSSEELQAAVTEFENNTWPIVTSVFGTPWTPGVDSDPRMVVFHSRLRSGVAGYYSSADQYPKQIVPSSNERETIYMSMASGFAPGSARYNAVLAHELQHASHWASDPSEESWLNEGMSEYASLLAGYPPASINTFTRSPSVSLTEWASDISAAGANYGASALFIEYLASHYGGNDFVSALVRETLDGYESVDAVLGERGYATTFEDVFEDWVIANLVDATSGPYSYPLREVPPLRTTSISLSNEITGSVRPFGTDYLEVANALGNVVLTFSGETTAPLFGVEPYSGDTCWWTNVGDSINTRLVRTVDLTGVGTATFSFWVWYDIERDWDYAYVTVSTDGGVTWQTVPTGETVSTNPNGNSYGHGLTGRSDGWVRDEADLAAFAGQEILLAIEYITDDAIHERGGCFDNFSIPEIDWFDDTSEDGGWTSHGFARVGNLQPLTYLVQVVRERPGQDAEVVKVEVGANGRGSAVLTGVERTESVSVVISAIQRYVTGSGDYTLELTRE